MNEEDIKQTVEARDDGQNEVVENAPSDAAWVEPVALEEIAPDQILLDLADPSEDDGESAAEPAEPTDEGSEADIEEEPHSDVNLDHIDLSIMAQRWQSVRHDENLVQLRALDASLKASHIEEEAQLRAGDIAVARRFHNSILYRSRGVALGILVFGVSTWVGAVTFGDRSSPEVAQKDPILEETTTAPEPLVAAVPPQVEVIPHEPLQMIGEGISTAAVVADETELPEVPGLQAVSEEALTLSEPAKPFAPPSVASATPPVVEAPKVDLPSVAAPVAEIKEQKPETVDVAKVEKPVTVGMKTEAAKDVVAPKADIVEALEPAPASPPKSKVSVPSEAVKTATVETSSDPAYVLQFGAFGSKSNAEKLVAKLKGRVPGMRIDQREVASGKKLYIVSGGAFRDADAAQKMAKRLKTSDRIDSFVRPQTQLARS